LGHAYSALLAHDAARHHGGAFLLRIEDLDQSRVRPEWEELVYQDLKWLGITWDEKPIKQSERKDAYLSVLSGVSPAIPTFTCTCNRRDIQQAMGAPHAEDMAFGPDGLIYPGTCRAHHYEPHNGDLDTLNLRLSLTQIQHEINPITHLENSDISFSNQTLKSMSFSEFQDRIGEVVLWRKGYAAYHLASVMDDAHQGITHVIRGQDLMEATHIHVLLQNLLGLPTPAYHHHGLIRDENGKRLAKRHDAKAIRKYREDGATPADIRRMVGL
jgi:glutamyl-Q tRNA(Asp) synthetase